VCYNTHFSRIHSLSVASSFKLSWIEQKIIKKEILNKRYFTCLCAQRYSCKVNEKCRSLGDRERKVIGKIHAIIFFVMQKQQNYDKRRRSAVPMNKIMCHWKVQSQFIKCSFEFMMSLITFLSRQAWSQNERGKVWDEVIENCVHVRRYQFHVINSF
jgi:hypothetical protein